MTDNPPTPTRQTYCAGGGCPDPAPHVQGSEGCGFAPPTPTPDEGLVERVTELLFEHDPMCGWTDCSMTARKIAPHIAALKPTGDRGELVRALRKCDPATDPMLARHLLEEAAQRITIDGPATLGGEM